MREIGATLIYSMSIIKFGIHLLKIFLCYTLNVVHVLDSQILSHEPSNFKNVLGEWLPKTGNWAACWRGTRDRWLASRFHRNCDGKIPTLVIVKVVKNSKNLIFGGYCTVTWDGRKF